MEDGKSMACLLNAIGYVIYCARNSSENTLRQVEKLLDGMMCIAWKEKALTEAATSGVSTQSKDQLQDNPACGKSQGGRK